MKKTNFYKDLFLTNRFFISWSILVVISIFSYFYSFLSIITYAGLLFLILISILDFGLLFLSGGEIVIQRKINLLLSNADENEVTLKMKSSFKFWIQTQIIDELPMQFQERNFSIHKEILTSSTSDIKYSVTPYERGLYYFGDIHVFVRTKISFLEKRFSANQAQTVKVYPSYLQLKNLQLKAIPEMQAFSKGQRNYKRGSSTEFDHIKEYNRGDDFRRINWRASSRKNELMVNSYMDEKSQQIYCIIDKGRLMKMPFHQLSLLDYAINASLMFSYVALQKEDKVGVLTFGEKVDDFLPTSKTRKQFQQIIELLYKQETRFLESNFSELSGFVRKKLGQRSLIMLFTNFETYIGFERQLPYFKAMNEKHLLCVVLFENTEIANIHHQRGDRLEDIYIKTIADKLMNEKKRMIIELRKYGILAMFSDPQQLSVQSVNKYLELKARHYL